MQTLYSQNQRNKNRKFKKKKKKKQDWSETDKRTQGDTGFHMKCCVSSQTLCLEEALMSHYDNNPHTDKVSDDNINANHLCRYTANQCTMKDHPVLLSMTHIGSVFMVLTSNTSAHTLSFKNSPTRLHPLHLTFYIWFKKKSDFINC